MQVQSVIGIHHGKYFNCGSHKHTACNFESPPYGRQKGSFQAPSIMPIWLWLNLECNRTYNNGFRKAINCWRSLRVHHLPGDMLAAPTKVKVTRGFLEWPVLQNNVKKAAGLTLAFSNQCRCWPKGDTLFRSHILLSVWSTGAMRNCLRLTMHISPILGYDWFLPFLRDKLTLSTRIIQTSKSRIYGSFHYERRQRLGILWVVGPAW